MFPEGRPTLLSNVHLATTSLANNRVGWIIELTSTWLLLEIGPRTQQAAHFLEYLINHWKYRCSPHQPDNIFTCPQFTSYLCTHALAIIIIWTRSLTCIQNLRRPNLCKMCMWDLCWISANKPVGVSAGRKFMFGTG